MMPADASQEAERPPLLRLSNVSKLFGGLAAVHPLNLDIAAGSFAAILGPSGCGKSTLLRIIAGFVEPSSGRILIDGRDVTRLGPEKRPTNMVFQGYGLFPHMTVAQNVAFGLTIAKKPRTEIAARVLDALGLVRLEELADRPVDSLSGGQQQRVALARALIMRPKILLLDEPLAALDLKLRQAMQEELRRIHKEIGGTFVFVTHDQGEAFALADRLIVINAGRVEQIGPPQEVYANPKTLFVAQFVGDTNVLRGYRKDGRAHLSVGNSFPSPGQDGDVTFVLRPESIQLWEEEREAAGVEAQVEDIVLLGSEARIVLTAAQGVVLKARTANPEQVRPYGPGTRLKVTWNATALREVGAPP